MYFVNEEICWKELAQFCFSFLFYLLYASQKSFAAKFLFLSHFFFSCLQKKTITPSNNNRFVFLLPSFPRSFLFYARCWDKSNYSVFFIHLFVVTLLVYLKYYTTLSFTLIYRSTHEHTSTCKGCDNKKYHQSLNSRYVHGFCLLVICLFVRYIFISCVMIEWHHVLCFRLQSLFRIFRFLITRIMPLT